MEWEGQSKTRQVTGNLAGFEERSFAYAGNTQFGIIAAFPIRFKVIDMRYNGIIRVLLFSIFPHHPNQRIQTKDPSRRARHVRGWQRGVLVCLVRSHEHQVKGERCLIRWSN
jgi:hypothetical protein